MSNCAIENETAQKRWEILRDHLEEFQSFLSERVSRLRVVNACDFHWSDSEWASRRDGELLRQCGVYLIFDGDSELIYVGVASWLDKRIWTHDKQPEFMRRPRRWTDVIPLSTEQAFLAPSLEEFLIARLRPAHNLKRR